MNKLNRARFNPVGFVIGLGVGVALFPSLGLAVGMAIGAGLSVAFGVAPARKC